ncbi:MAG: SAM-dependent methyltransferase [Chitinophagaceae bacterium]
MATVYLIPSPLHDEGMDSLPAYIINAIKECHIFFVENERTTRRFLKRLWKQSLPGQVLNIDEYEWVNMTDSPTAADIFKTHLKRNETIGIISEAGCPGVADPGQVLVELAHQLNAAVKPLVGPSSIMLALMASGMNGQRFQFLGYLPIENQQRIRAIKEMESESLKKKCTQIFIETPYRNNQLIEALLNTCKPSSKLCIAVNLTGKNEWIKTRTISAWQKEKPDIHKRPAIFLLYGALLD